MAKLTEFLTGIADAIRAKKGTTEPIPALNFAEEIASIETGRDPVLETLEATENGEYVPSEEVDGFSKVTVQVEPALSELEVVENGVYVPDEGVYGFSEVTVQIEPVLTALEVTENGVYVPGEEEDGFSEVTVQVEPALSALEVTENGVYVPNEDMDGFSEVTVKVEPALSALEVTENGVYAPEEGTDGFSEVTVNVEQGVFLPELTNPAAAEDIVLGKEAIDQNGEKVAGTMPENAAEVVMLDATTPLYQIPAGKHTGEGTVGIELEEVTVVLSDEQQEITPTAGKVLGKVIVPAGGGGDDESVITDASYLFYKKARIDAVESLLKICKRVTSCLSMFDSCGNVTGGLDVTGLDTSECTSMASMFYSTGSTKLYGLETLDTSKVTSMSSMFGARQGSTTPPDLSNFNTSNVTTMANMFAGGGLSGATLDLRHFDVSKVTTFASMFYNTSVKEVLISGWKPLVSCSMQNMFQNSTSIERMDFSEVDTSKVTNMSGIFNGCTKLTEIVGFSAANKAGMSIYFAIGTATSLRCLKRLTFRTDLPEGTYAIRSAINIKYCSFTNEGLAEMFATLPDVSGLGLSSSNTTISITGNPCVTDGSLTDDTRALATSRGWTLVE